jgi:nitrilase
MIKIAGIQIAPVFLNAQKTWEKLIGYIREAASKGAELVTWGETLIPGYPIWGWLNSQQNHRKTIYNKYWEESIKLDDSSIVEEMKVLAKELGVMMMGGIAEKYGGSTYCCLLTVSKEGEILGRHRKVKPTYVERLVWADGDGLGLKTYKLNEIKIGGLNCWENWLPLARAKLHLQEEILHVAVWPGSIKDTEDITRFIAIEGRSWVISVSGLYRSTDTSHLDKDDFPLKDKMESSWQNSWLNGGTMVVDPKGKVVAGPLIEEEGIVYATIDPKVAIQERSVFDISGHYSRFDIFNKP